MFSFTIIASLLMTLIVCMFMCVSSLNDDSIFGYSV